MPGEGRRRELGLAAVSERADKAGPASWSSAHENDYTSSFDLNFPFLRTVKGTVLDNF